MAKDQTDHLGRVTGTVPEARTVTEFAVQQGTLDGSDPDVKAALEDERKREKAGRERAQRVSDQMAPEPQAEENDGE